jgi:hypothetical protein
MYKKHIIILVGCLIGTWAAMLGLYAYSPLTAKIYRASFDRRLAPQSIVQQVAEVDLRHNSFYIAGMDESVIYLGNYTRPFLLLTVDKKTSKVTKNQIELVGLDSIATPSYFRTIVSDGYYFLAHGVAPVVYRGKVGTWTAEKMNLNKDDYFDQILPLTRSSFALRFYSSIQNGYAIGKKEINPSPTFKQNTSLLQKQGEGVFSVDGTLHYSQHLNKLLYLYLYRNQYMVLDTTLTLSFRANTIDTFSRARIKVAEVTETRSMIASPPAVINRSSWVDGKFLFIESALLAHNEDQINFTQSSVVDVYRIHDKQYTYSFYLKNEQNQKTSEFKVLGNTLAAIIGDRLILYNLNLDLFENFKDSTTNLQ